MKHCITAAALILASCTPASAPYQLPTPVEVPEDQKDGLTDMNFTVVNALDVSVTFTVEYEMSPIYGEDYIPIHEGSPAGVIFENVTVAAYSETTVENHLTSKAGALVRLKINVATPFGPLTYGTFEVGVDGDENWSQQRRFLVPKDHGTDVLEMHLVEELDARGVLQVRMRHYLTFRL